MSHNQLVPGAQNLITDVAGLRIGNASDSTLRSGSTVLIGQEPMTTAVHVMGGAPGTRETDLLAPDKTVQKVDALVLSGGSAFGLDAASGVVDALRLQDRGFLVGDQRVPIVPAAILFDLTNGGDKNWEQNPYAHLGRAALANATTSFPLGSIGAGFGATTATLRGGLGSASVILPSGQTVGAIIAVNALGSPIVANGPHFWAAPFEMNSEFGGVGLAPQAAFAPESLPTIKGGPTKNTTIGIVATDADLTQAQAQRMATAAHDGFARALYPSHTPFDGDLMFAISTGAIPLEDEVTDPLLLGHAAALCVARAIARGIHAASAAPFGMPQSWSERFGTSKD
ncbi:MAG: P1 family peptidase [Pseudoruegeria sp.]